MSDGDDGDQVERGVGTMFMPRRPVRYGDARPGSRRRSRDRRAGPTRRGPGRRAVRRGSPPRRRRRHGRGRRRSGVRSRTSALSRRPRKKSSSMAGARSTVAMAMTAKPPPCEPPVRRCDGPLKSWISCWKGAYITATQIWPPMPMAIPTRSTAGNGRRGRAGSRGCPGSGWPARARR